MSYSFLLNRIPKYKIPKYMTWTIQISAAIPLGRTCDRPTKGMCGETTIKNMRKPQKSKLKCSEMEIMEHATENTIQIIKSFLRYFLFRSVRIIMLYTSKHTRYIKDRTNRA